MAHSAQIIADDRVSSSYTSTYVFVLLIAAVVIATNVLIEPSRFADYYTYLLITDQLYYFSGDEIFRFEAASHATFLGLRMLTGSTVAAVDIAHHLLGAGFILGLVWLVRHFNVSWQSLLVFFALYGALLAFVVIRATPAYFLVAYAALEANRGRRIAIPLALLALLFHVSAVLALPAVIASLAQNRFGALAWIGRSTAWLLVGAMTYATLFFFFRDTFEYLLRVAVSSVPFLSKYLTYTAALDPINAPVAETTSVFHYVYFGVVSLFAVAFILMPEEKCRAFRSYLIVSYVLFVLLQFSPVTAFRQSLFWMMPAVFLFPWQRFAPAGIQGVLLMLGCVALYAYGFPGILA